MAQLYVHYPLPPMRHPREGRLQGQAWAEKALKLDDTLAEAYTALAKFDQMEWDWPGAERHFRRAIELNPNYAQARAWYAQYLFAMQRFEEAVAEAKVAQQIEPVSPDMLTWLGVAYCFAGRHKEAKASWQKVLELDPSYWWASHSLGRSYMLEGKHQQAIAEFQRALTFNPKEGIVLGALAHTYARAGQREEALKIVAELKRMDAERQFWPYFAIIHAYAGLGDKDQAFAWLERAYQERRASIAWINVDPFLEPLRSDPRFEDLVRRVGLPTKSPPRQQ